MKKLFLLLAPLTLGLMVGCSYDDSTILDKIAEMEKEHDEMQAQIDAQQKLLDALANKLTITDVIQTSNGYTITLSDGTSMTIKDGEPGDNFIESVVVGEEDVTFTLTDGTVIVIPLGCSSSGSGDTYAENNKIYYTTSDNTKLFPITDASLYGAILISNTYKDGQGVLVFDDAVTKIGGDAFGWCESLTSVTIPDSVTEIGDYAFSNCSSLQEFRGKFASEDGRCLIIDGTLNSFAPAGLSEYTIPDSVTTIGWAAFEYCGSLTSVTIPDSVTTIGYYAFSWCESLTSVYCKATTPPAFDGDVFGDASDLKIYVPMESVETYKSAEWWSRYADVIVGYDFENGAIVTPKPANNEIWYTSIDGEIVEPYSGEYNGYAEAITTFGVNIVSNIYADGKGVIEFDGDVTIIGDYAFIDCNNLTSITIPDSVTTIGVGAFYGCYNLTSVTIPDSVTTIEWGAFSWCESLTSVTIPNSVTTIETQAFQYCSLTSVTIPDSVTTIGGGAFYCCSSLQEFNGKFASEDGRCLIVDGTLNDFAPAGLTEYTIPDSVTTIGVAAFRDCSSLTSVTIPDSVAEIGEMAFFGCYSLTSVTIPDSVTEIKYYAFAYCYGLTSVTIPDSVTTIGEAAFYGCSSLKSVTIPDSVTTIGDNAFRDCSSLTSATIPDSVTTIGNLAFAVCSSLTSVTIPDSVTEIGWSAFEGCSSLTSVIIGDSVTTIGDYAFEDCSSLTSVTIPDSVTTIGYATFANCENLKTVYCKAINPPTTIVNNYGYWFGFAKEDENGNIYNIDCTIYVPTESVNKYKSAGGWSEYASSIEGYNF